MTQDIDPKAPSAYRATVRLDIEVLVTGTHGEFTMDSDDLHAAIVRLVREHLTGRVAAAIDGIAVGGASNTRYFFPGEEVVSRLLPGGKPITVTVKEVMA